MKNKTLLICISILAIFIWNSCSEQPTSVPDVQNVDGTLSKTHYVSGTDITEQLRNDLNAGLSVTLPAGHFYVSETIVVQGYSGTVKGAGKDATIIETLEDFKAVPTLDSPPYEITAIFVALWSKGDVTFKDMTILVTGEAPAEPHHHINLGMVTTIDHAIVVTRVSPESVTGIEAKFQNLRIIGENSTDDGAVYEKNLVYPLTATGKGEGVPISAVFKDCEIENASIFGIGYVDSYGGSGDIKNNVISNTRYAVWLRNNLDSEIIIKNNNFNNITVNPIVVVDPLSKYCFKNNTLDGIPITDECQ